MNEDNKKYNAGTMTEAALRSYIMSGLRDKSRWWKPKTKAITRARVGRGRYKCEECGTIGPGKLPALPGKKRERNNADADHTETVVPIEGFAGDADSSLFLGYNWTEVIRRLFIEQDGYKTLCYKCHKAKTDRERLERAKFKKLNK